VAKLCAYLSYRDAGSALEWLQKIGFEITTKDEAADGRINHAELRLGEAAIMVASFDAEYEIAPLRGRSTGSGTYLVLDDVQGVYEKAVAAGATSVFAPEQTEWGSWRARVLDTEGHEWSFGSYEPGQGW